MKFPPDIPRLARALHRLFPMVGGLGRPMINTYTKDTMYDLWDYGDPRHSGVFRLLEELEKLRGQRACLLSLFNNLMIDEGRYYSMSLHILGAGCDQIVTQYDMERNFNMYAGVRDGIVLESLRTTPDVPRSFSLG